MRKLMCTFSCLLLIGCGGDPLLSDEQVSTGKVVYAKNDPKHGPRLWVPNADGKQHSKVMCPIGQRFKIDPAVPGEKRESATCVASDELAQSEDESAAS